MSWYPVVATTVVVVVTTVVVVVVVAAASVVQYLVPGVMDSLIQHSTLNIQAVQALGCLHQQIQKLTCLHTTGYEVRAYV